MRVVRVDPAKIDAEAIAEAAAVLRDGGLVAFPTETVYGLGAHAMDPGAIDRLYRAKGRPAYNPLIVHVPDTETAHGVVAAWPEAAKRLAERFWPGPLTLVLPKRAEVPDGVTGGLSTVGVRVPSHPVALALLRAAGVPVAAPSANRSTEVSPTTAAHVSKSLGNAVDMIVDGGPTSVGIESTVLDLSAGSPAILRPGMITRAQIEGVLGPITTRRDDPRGAEARPSPGMLDRHYAPRARVVLVDHGDTGAITDAVERQEREGLTVGALLLTDVAAGPYRVFMPAKAAPYAARLYETLHALDESGCEAIVVERVPSGAEWEGVRDRLERAARA